jgi:hypothetical protein
LSLATHSVRHDSDRTNTKTKNKNPLEDLCFRAERTLPCNAQHTVAPAQCLARLCDRPSLTVRAGLPQRAGRPYRPTMRAHACAPTATRAAREITLTQPTSYTLPHLSRFDKLARYRGRMRAPPTWPRATDPTRHAPPQCMPRLLLAPPQHAATRLPHAPAEPALAQPYADAVLVPSHAWPLLGPLPPPSCVRPAAPPRCSTRPCRMPARRLAAGPAPVRHTCTHTPWSLPAPH